MPTYWKGTRNGQKHIERKEYLSKKYANLSAALQDGITVAYEYAKYVLGWGAAKIVQYLKSLDPKNQTWQARVDKQLGAFDETASQQLFGVGVEEAAEKMNV